MVAGHKLPAQIEVERHSEAKMDFRLNDNSNNHTHLDLAGLPDKGGGDLMAVGCWCLCSETGDIVVTRVQNSATNVIQISAHGSHGSLMDLFRFLSRTAW